jgi:hypothetical protein
VDRLTVRIWSPLTSLAAIETLGLAIVNSFKLVLGMDLKV